MAPPKRILKPIIEPSNTSHGTMIPRGKSARSMSSSSDMTPPYTSVSSSLTNDSCDSELPCLLSREDQKKLLLESLMSHFFNLFNSQPRQRAGAPSSSSKNTSPASSTSSSLSEESPLLRPKSTVTAASRRRGSGRGKRAAERDADGDSDDEEGGRRRSKVKIARTDEIETRRLACPFFKRDPHRFKEERSCVGPGWMTVHRVK